MPLEGTSERLFDDSTASKRSEVPIIATGPWAIVQKRESAPAPETPGASAHRMACDKEADEALARRN